MAQEVMVALETPECLVVAEAAEQSVNDISLFFNNFSNSLIIGFSFHYLISQKGIEYIKRHESLQQLLV